jgi:hypothetical protein
MLLPAVASADVAPSSGETVIGELVQAWQEHEEPHDAVAHAAEGPLTWIETDTGETVRVPTEDLADDLTGDPGAAAALPVGATVEVVLGGEVPDEAATEEGLDPARAVLAAEVVDPAPAGEPTLGAAVTDEVTVVMMIPPGGAAQPGRTLADVVAAVNGPVAQFWAEQSDDAVQITASATNYDWFQGTVDCSNPSALWNEAAAHAGWSPGTGKHLMVYLPRNTPGCSYGLAQVGSSLTAGGRLYVTDVVTSVIAHELGHNFSLGHSSGQQCDRSVDAGTCQVEAYRDYYDVMGVSWSQVGSLNAPQSARLGLLPGAQQQAVTTATAGGTYTLTPLAGRTGVRAIRLTDPEGAVYWLEYRSAAGRDSWLGASATNPYALQPGVLLRRSSPMPNTSLLLDATPSAPSGWAADRQVALAVGSTVSLSGGDFVVTVTDATASAATVKVSSVGGDPQCLGRGEVSSSGVALSTLRSGLYAFGVGTDRQLWYRPVARSVGWQSLGGVSLYGPAAVTSGTTSFVFVVGGDGALYMRTENGYGWGPWTSLGGYLTSSPAAASLGDGHLRVFGRGADNGLWTREFAGGSWSAWSYLGGVITSPPAATAYPAYGQVEVSVRGTDSRLYTMGLSVGARSSGYLARNFSACSALAVPAATTAPLPFGRVFLDAADGIREIDRAGAPHAYGGLFLSNPAVQYPGSSTVIAGTGGDRALWVYDTRPGGVGGWVSLGGQLL